MMKEKEILQTGSYEDLKNYSEKNKENYETLLHTVSERAQQAALLGRKLEEARSLAQKTALEEKELRKELNLLKDQTAKMVEVVTGSDFFAPVYEELPSVFENFGTLVKTESFEPKTKEWLEARFDTIGGSDVGVLVVNEFSEDIKYWDKLSLKKLITSKTVKVTDEDVKAQDYSQEKSKGGPLYRGTVWEDLARDRFARENPNYTVYNSKDQYANKDRSFQQVNFDGILSDREDKVPNGILELKTGTYVSDWSQGVPLNYRAQVLYYLNASGFDYAIVGVLINDGDLLSFKLHKNDSVAPGVYEGTMEDYINEKLIPWWRDIKTS